MSETLLGQLAPKDASRDAIHIACAPVTSDVTIYPGEHLYLVEGSSDKVRPVRLSRSSGTPATVGISDPYLKVSITAGQLFWLCLYPKTVTSLRHEWTHPAFKFEPSAELSELEKSKIWLTKYADDCGVDYEQMMNAIKNDDYINMGENENYKGMYSDDFAKHCSIVLGVDKDYYPPFSCSC